MGERQNQPFQLSSNASLKVDFQGAQVTADGGLILVRELDGRLCFGDLIARYLTDSRRGKNTQLPLADLLRRRPRGSAGVNVTVTPGGGPGTAAMTATSPIFTPIVATVNVTAVPTVSLEVHQ
jgi:hypothetical protein